MLASEATLRVEYAPMVRLPIVTVGVAEVAATLTLATKLLPEVPAATEMLFVYVVSPPAGKNEIGDILLGLQPAGSARNAEIGKRTDVRLQTAVGIGSLIVAGSLNELHGKRIRGIGVAQTDINGRAGAKINGTGARVSARRAINAHADAYSVAAIDVPFKRDTIQDRRTLAIAQGSAGAAQGGRAARIILQHECKPVRAAAGDIGIGETGGEIVRAHGLVEDHAVGLIAHVGSDCQHVAADDRRGAVQGPTRAIAAETGSAGRGRADVSAAPLAEKLTLPVPSAGGGGDHLSARDGCDAGIGVGPHQAERAGAALGYAAATGGDSRDRQRVIDLDSGVALKVIPRSVVAAGPL